MSPVSAQTCPLPSAQSTFPTHGIAATLLPPLAVYLLRLCVSCQRLLGIQYLLYRKLSYLLKAGRGLSPGVVAVLAWPRQGSGGKWSELRHTLQAELTSALEVLIVLHTHKSLQDHIHLREAGLKKS